LTDLTKADVVRVNASLISGRNSRSCQEGPATECAILFLRAGGAAAAQCCIVDWGMVRQCCRRSPGIGEDL